MLDLVVFNEVVQKIWLVCVTLIFVLVGLVIVWYSGTSLFLGSNCWYEGKVVSAGTIFSKGDSECGCNEGKILCEKIDSLERDEELEVEDFTRDNLQFNTRYITSSVSSQLEVAPLKTMFTSIRNLENGIEVVLHQAQLCSNDSTPPVQIGMYHASEASLILMIIANTAPSLYTRPCTVEATFTITDFGYNPAANYALSYRNEPGTIMKANICSYNGRLFNHGDRYEAIDRCNICMCDHGISRCGNDRVCSQ